MPKESGDARLAKRKVYGPIVDAAERPVSPTQLSRMLKGRGINVSRETLVKYCKANGIPTVSQAENVRLHAPLAVLDHHVLGATTPIQPSELADKLRQEGVDTTAHGIRRACQRLGIEMVGHTNRKKNRLVKYRKKLLDRIALRQSAIMRLRDEIVAVSRKIRSMRT